MTKPLVTGLLCARLVQSDELTLDSSIANYLLEFDRPDKHLITVRQLLTHTSGLPAWRPLYILTSGEKDAAVAAIADQPLAYKPGERVVYSDLGFIAIGFLLQRLTGMQFDRLARRDIFDRLHLQRTFFNPALAIQTEVAACENGNSYERDMCELDPALPAMDFTTIDQIIDASVAKIAACVFSTSSTDGRRRSTLASWVVIPPLNIRAGTD